MLNTFDVKLFKQELDTQWLGRNVHHFDKLDSTNVYAKQLPKDQVSQGLICITDNQLKGRGQYDRGWESEPGKNLTFTLIFLPGRGERFHILTLACALSLVECLKNLTGSDECACIKWPNDVLLNDRKVAGLLTESIFTGDKVNRLLIGIGINVNQTTFSEDNKKKATSIAVETGKAISREKLLAAMMNRIEHTYGQWHTHNEDLLKSINRSIKGHGQRVKLKVDGTVREDKYKFIGISDEGSLLVLDKEDGIESFSYEQIRLIID